MPTWKILLIMASCASAAEAASCEETYNDIARKTCILVKAGSQPGRKGKDARDEIRRGFRDEMRLLSPPPPPPPRVPRPPPPPPLGLAQQRAERAQHLLASKTPKERRNLWQALQVACDDQNLAATLCSKMKGVGKKALPSGSNNAAPQGYVAKQDSGPCKCEKSGLGLESCGKLCCAASPYTDPRSDGLYPAKTMADMCYEKAARMYKEGDDSVKVAAVGAPWGVNMVVVGFVFLGLSFLLITRVVYIYKKDLTTPGQEASTEPESELGLLSTMPE